MRERNKKEKERVCLCVYLKIIKHFFVIRFSPIFITPFFVVKRKMPMEVKVTSVTI